MGFYVCNWGYKVLVNRQVNQLHYTLATPYHTYPFQIDIQFQRSEDYTWQHRYKQYGAIV